MSNYFCCQRALQYVSALQLANWFVVFQHEVARKHWWDQQVSKLSVKLLECKRDGT